MIRKEELNLTTEWDNVDPIKNYTYINNLDGTQKPYGYQKIEIKNGVTKLTHKDGEIITEVTGESKARLLTLEEVFEQLDEVVKPLKYFSIYTLADTRNVIQDILNKNIMIVLQRFKKV